MSPAFLPTILDDIDSILQRSVDEFVKNRNSGLARAVVLATSSQEPVLLSSVAGYEQVLENLDESPTVSDESLFPLWSATKLVAVIAAMQLVEQGKLRLEDDASKYVPELRDLKVLVGFDDDDKPRWEEPKHAPTVENLITHTAGFKYMYDPNYTKYHKQEGLASIYDEDSTRETLTRSPFLVQPGIEYTYGTANDWLALTVANVSGLPFDQYLEREIFEPLGITDMTFTNPRNRVSTATVPEPAQGSDAAATGSTSASEAVATPAAPAFVFDQDRQFPQAIAWGGAGLTGSARSYLKILRMLLRSGASPVEGRGPILRRDTVDLMFRPRFDDKVLETFLPFVKEGNDPWSHKRKEQFPGVNHGLGGTLSGEGFPSGRSKGAMTWSGAANTFWVVDRQKDVAFVVWTSLLPHSHPSLMDVWEKVEPKIYEGLSASASAKH
ncbi:hypothetical protein JCM10212_007158 [Sporobolomyces blumeae]